MKRVLQAAAALALGALANTASAQAASPFGVWLDHTGRAAIEITDCGNKLCGKIVWLKDSNHKSACGLQIIGNVPKSGSKWDGGWILDPEKDSKYDVEITPLGEDKLKVMGYAGMKFLSETYTWTKAQPDLQRCDRTAQRTPDSETPQTPDGNRPRAQADGAPGGTSRPTETERPRTQAEVQPKEQQQQPQETPRTAAPDKQKTSSSKQCTFDLGFVKVTAPCDDDD